MHHNIVSSYVPRLIMLIKHVFCRVVFFSTRSPLLVPVLTLLVQYILAPTLTVSWGWWLLCCFSVVVAVAVVLLF